MAEASIPVDLLNPGQVFACLGFLEAAEELIGDARAGFDWSDEADIRFRLSANGEDNPFCVVLETLSKSVITEIEPVTWPGDHMETAVVSEVFPSPLLEHYADKKWSRTKLPVRFTLSTNQKPMLIIDCGNWADDSGRPVFKLYSGNRSAYGIAKDMLFGKRKKPTGRNPEGKLENKGLRQLLEEKGDRLCDDPLGITCPVAGSFNMDPRGAWVAMDLGFSLDKQKHIKITASPIVEILATLAMEHARPDEYEVRRVRYGVWSDLLPPLLARAALAGVEAGTEIRRYRFVLDLSGKNKVVTFAEPDE